MAVVAAWGNDGVYFTSGNMLVPVQETSISIAKEELTIIIGSDSMATVVVYYEFHNPDSAKMVTMAFEADAPYNSPLDEVKSKSHPYIHNFKVKMNGERLSYRNAYIKRDSAMTDAYGYYFRANFKPGKNIVQHFYKYKMSYNIASQYEIHYWLTPALRWANHRIDDFTLRIKKDHYLDYTIIDSLFAAEPFKFKDNLGQIYPFTTEFGEHCSLFSCGKGDVLEWHAKNFVPKADLTITSVDRYLPTRCPYLWATRAKVVIEKNGDVTRFIGESGENYLVDAQDYGMVRKNDAKVVEFSAENGEGWLIIRNDEGQGVNVRKQPTTESPILCTIRDIVGELPIAYPCLGLVKHYNAKRDYTEEWFKIDIDGKVGYVRSDLMIWDSINTY